MTALVARDWRGIKFRLSGCTTEELQNLAVNAEQTQDEIDRFLESIRAELAHRRASTQLRAA